MQDRQTIHELEEVKKELISKQAKLYCEYDRHRKLISQFVNDVDELLRRERLRAGMK
jgi:hypothetical protein